MSGWQQEAGKRPRLLCCCSAARVSHLGALEGASMGGLLYIHVPSPWCAVELFSLKKKILQPLPPASKKGAVSGTRPAPPTRLQRSSERRSTVLAGQGSSSLSFPLHPGPAAVDTYYNLRYIASWEFTDPNYVGWVVVSLNTSQPGCELTTEPCALGPANYYNARAPKPVTIILANQGTFTRTASCLAEGVSLGRRRKEQGACRGRCSVHWCGPGWGLG
jgi:hypothetical protein